MRRALALLALTALVLAGCGGDDSSSSGTTTTKASGDGSTTTTADGGTTTTGDADSGDVDCTDLKAALAKLIVPIQLMVQVKTLDALASIKDKTIGDYDGDEVLSALATLRVLEAHQSPLGDPKEALDFYQDTAEKLNDLIAEGAPTEAEVQSYADSIGSVTEFLGHQTALAGAMDDAGC